MNLPATSKEEILNVCQKIVKEKGILAINMRSVAIECNIAVGSIYNYFPSKSELLCSVIESVWKDIFYLVGKKVEFYDFIECLTWLFESIKEGRKKYPEFFSIHALSFASEDKTAGRQMMEKYFINLKQILLETLEKDPHIKKNVFNEILTPILFVDYIFTLFISSLLEPQQNCKALLEIVKKCLY